MVQSKQTIMTPTHCIFNLQDGKLALWVMELPESCKNCQSKNYCFDTCEKQMQALANRIRVKEERHVDAIRILVGEQYSGWEPKEMKPYKLPDGLEWDIRKHVLTWDDFGNPNTFAQFAFLKQPKEQVKIAHIGAGGEGSESQDELWAEAIMLLMKQGVTDLKSKFTIQRR